MAASNFWKTQEGTTAKIILGVLGAGLLGLSYMFQTQLVEYFQNMVELTQNFFYLIAMGFGGVAVVWFIRKYGFILLTMISRMINKALAIGDPVGILEAFINQMKKKLTETQEAITDIQALRNNIIADIKKKTQERDQAVRLATEAEKLPNDPDAQMTLKEQLEKIARRENAINNRQSKLEFADQTLEALHNIERVVKYNIRSSEDQKNELKEDYAFALKTIAATNAAKGVIGENGTEDIRQAAIEAIQNRVSTATAEVESLLNSTKAVRGEIDLNEMALRSEGQARLADLRQRAAQGADKAVGSGATARILTAGEVPATLIQPSQSTENIWVRRNTQK